MFAGPTLQPITSKEHSATVKWEEPLPDSHEVYISVNTSDDNKLERMNGAGHNIGSLIPGFQQVVTVKLKEGNTYRLLREETFKTSGNRFLWGHLKMTIFVIQYALVNVHQPGCTLISF